MSTKEQRINERINVPSVRLVGSAGEQLGVKTTEEARKLADDEGMDLVMVSPTAEPPVCKIMDFGKFKYEQKKRQHDHQHKHQPQIKELRLRPKTDEHDMMVRVKQAREFIARGDRVTVNMLFRGREMAHIDLGKALLEKFTKALEDVAKVERPPVLEGKRMGIVLLKK